MIPWPGGFTAWHDPPVVTLPSGSRIRDGQKVLLSYYHTAIIYEEQVMCCMAEPKLYEILRWQIEQVHKHLQPDGYFLQHDEIRVQGWDESCRRTGKTPGELLAENVGKCVALVRGEDAGKPIYVWSDMFDPSHNAQKSGRYYLVKGDGPWYGSWKGLDKDVVIVNWNSDPGKRRSRCGTSPTWETGRSSPDTTTGRWARSAAGSGMASSAGDHRGDVHHLAAPVPRPGGICRRVETALSVVFPLPPPPNVVNW